MAKIDVKFSKGNKETLKAMSTVYGKKKPSGKSKTTKKK